MTLYFLLSFSFFGFLCFTMFYHVLSEIPITQKSHNQQAISAGPIHDGATTTIVFRTASAQFASSTLLSCLSCFPYSHQLLQDQLISIKEICICMVLLSRVSLTLSEYLRVVAEKFGPRPSCYQPTPYMTLYFPYCSIWFGTVVSQSYQLLGYSL